MSDGREAETGRGGEPLLQVEDLNIRFGERPAVVENVSFRIAAGETLGLVGESGSGKSLASLALLGLLPREARVSGGVRFAGRELLGAPEGQLRRIRGCGIAMVFQEPMTALNPVMRAGAQVAEAVRVHEPGIGRRALRKRVAEAFEEVGLEDAVRRAGEYPHQFSGGQRQRLVIAMALVNRPRLLIADEPTTALDVTVQAQILALLRSLQRSHGLGMLFISHDLAVVRQIAQRIAVLERGRVVELGEAQKLFAAPQHAYTRRLLASVPTMSTDRTRLLGT